MRSSRSWLLSPAERDALNSLRDAATADPSRAVRARAVLLTADGLDIGDVAQQVGLAPATVIRWISRYRRDGISGLADRSRRRKKIVEEIAAVDRDVLSDWMDSDEVPEDVRRRARAMVLLADGVALKDICHEIGVSGPILWKWRQRYRKHGVHGLRGRSAADSRPELPEDHRVELERWQAQPGTDRAVRARIVLLAAARTPTAEIAEQVGRSPTAVRKWIKRYAADGLSGLRSGAARPRPLVEVAESDRPALLEWLERPDVDAAAARRARAVMLAADGERIKDIARRFGVQPGSVSDWLRRYRERGAPGLVTRRGGRSSKHATLTLPARDREVLQVWADSRELKTFVIRRARAVLLTADGESPADTACWSGMSAGSVLKWVERYLADGITALLGPEPGDGAGVSEVDVVLATLERPPGERHWTPQLLAGEVVDAAPATIAKIWSRWGLRPSRVAPWSFNAQPRLPVEGCEVVGLYLNPPDRVLVLESSAGSGRGVLRMREALAASERPVGGAEGWAERHLRYLRRLVDSRPDAEFHLVCEAGGSHRHPKVGEWLARHPGISVHLPPDAVAWHAFAAVWLGIMSRRWCEAARAREFAGDLATEIRRLKDPLCWLDDSPAAAAPAADPQAKRSSGASADR